MENEVLIALFTKIIEERLAAITPIPGPRGPRGLNGLPGVAGKDFNFAEHEATIRGWAKEFALKFEDFTAEQIQKLRGPRGADGKDGRDGKDFVWAEHTKELREWCQEFALKFEDLTAEQIEAIRGPRGKDGRDGKDFDPAEHAEQFKELAEASALKFEDLTSEQISALRGPRGKDGKDGKDGTGFEWTSHSDKISEIVRSAIKEMSEGLKLRFSDLSAGDIEQLRGPRGRDGRDGRGFVFEEHRDYFDSLKLKFSDLTPEERDSLRLKFSGLTDDERASLKLRFDDLTDDDRALIRGPRGVRGQRGSAGRDGRDGKDGRDGRPGPRGMMGLPGVGRDGAPGINGADGKDAPHIVDIDVEQVGDDIIFVFEFSDGKVIRSDRVTLPAVNVIGGSTANGGKGKSVSDVRIDEVSSTLTYIGKTAPGNLTSQDVWQIQRITEVGTETIVEFADSNSKYDNVWDDRADLSYG